MSAPADVRYAHSADGIDIAYQVAGDGPVDIVFVPGFVSHLDLMWDFPTFAAIRDRLAQIGRVVTFDKRGTGLSDRTLGFGSLEARMHDIRDVMDAVGMTDAHLFGISEGGPLAVLFAAQHPERARSIAIYGTFARLLRGPDYESDIDEELVDVFVDAVRDNWGSGRAMSYFIQHIPRSDDIRRMVSRYERNACTPQMAADVLRRNAEIDIRALLPSVRVPVLVLHSRDDPLVPVDHARRLAEQLPQARFVEGAGDFHATWDSEDLWFLDEVEHFISGERPTRQPAQRVLATVMFTDIVGSTERAAAMGDRPWRKVLDRHDEVGANTVDRFGGRVVKTTGDGLLATFDSPSAGVRCAREVEERVAPFGLQIRAGVHTGEVELRGGDVGGIGVHIGARIAALAGPGEVWVSRTVKELTTGSGLTLRPCGRHTLKGMPEEWDLYRVDGSVA